MNKTLNAALIGGGTFGILSALPYIQYANTLCCALYIGGGVFAMYLYMRDQGAFAKAPYAAKERPWLACCRGSSPLLLRRWSVLF